MDADIQRFSDEWATGDRGLAKTLAKTWIANHRDKIQDLEGYDLEGLVGLVTQYRAAGCESDRLIVDMWLLSEYESQQITGVVTIGSTASVVAEAEGILGDGLSI